ncbi:MAG: hypothetical protein AAGF12_41870 [Myxococcota bacterium]
MTDPERLLDDPSLDEGVRSLLEASTSTPPMTSDHRERLSTFVTRVAAGAAVTGTLLSAKAVAAILLVGGGAAVAAVQISGTTATEDSVVADANATGAGDRNDGARRSPSAPTPPSEEETPPSPAPSDPNSGVQVAGPTDETADSIDGTADSIDGTADSIDGTAGAAETAGPNLRGDDTRRQIEHRHGATQTGSRLQAVSDRNSIGGLGAAPASDERRSESPDDPLREEVRLLERAQALVASHPSAAIQEAEVHRRAFPRGQLAQERELIIVDALLRIGQRSEAVRRAEALIARNPNGMYARRARRLIGN